MWRGGLLALLMAVYTQGNELGHKKEVVLLGETGSDSQRPPVVDDFQRGSLMIVSSGASSEELGQSRKGSSVEPGTLKYPYAADSPVELCGMNEAHFYAGSFFSCLCY